MTNGTRQAVAAVVRRGAEILLVRQQGLDDPDPGWALPGGVVEPDELLDAALARELREETGLVTEGPRRLIYVSQHDHPEFGVFTALVFELDAGTDGADADGDTGPDGDAGREIADPDGDIVEARWFSEPEAIEVLDRQPFRPMRDPIVEFLRGRAVVPTVWVFADATGPPEIIPPLRRR